MTALTFPDWPVSQDGFRYDRLPRHLARRHGALELTLGLALMASPFVFVFGPAASIAAAAVGTLIVGLALAAATLDERGSIAAHQRSTGVRASASPARASPSPSGEVAAGTTFARRPRADAPFPDHALLTRS